MDGRAGGRRASGARRRGAAASPFVVLAPGLLVPEAARRPPRAAGAGRAPRVRRARRPRASTSRLRPVAKDPKPSLPVTYTDVTGKPITITDTRRILALDSYGTLASTVYALGLGDRLVGRDVSTGIPTLRHLPLVTHNGHELNAEAILDLHPTVDAHRLHHRSARGAAPAARRRHPGRDHERPPVARRDRPADPGGGRRARRARPSGSSSSTRVDERDQRGRSAHRDRSRRRTRSGGCAWCSSTCAATRASTTGSARAPAPTT